MLLIKILLKWQKYENDEPLKVSKDNSSIKIFDLHDKTQIYEYKKINSNENYYNYILNQYLITKVENSNRNFYRIIDIKTGKLEFECREVQYLDNVLFYDELI